ncbi:P1 family peptidase, partial [Kribbia dieselivorans]|uniref:P1 family peptidase n=1 Tax=Kribbia dieselivorans TaxID=331526 RepID=UPI00157A48D0
EDGSTVAALVVCNALGSAIHPDTGALHAAPFLHDCDVVDLVAQGRLGVPSAAELAAAPRAATGDELRPASATTIGIVATDATLTKAQCAKLAGIGHDGLARALRPVHTMFDGDTLFGLATGSRPAPEPPEMHRLLEVAADVVTRSVARAVLAATSVETPAGSWPAYLDALPSVGTRRSAGS